MVAEDLKQHRVKLRTIDCHEQAIDDHQQVTGIDDIDQFIEVRNVFHPRVTDAEVGTVPQDPARAHKTTLANRAVNLPKTISKLFRWVARRNSSVLRSFSSAILPATYAGTRIVTAESRVIMWA